MGSVRSAGFLGRLFVGAALFAVAQAVVSSLPPLGSAPPSEAPNWFLNSLHGVVAVGVAFFAAGLGSVFAGARDVTAAALPLSIGGAVAAGGVYAWLGGGELFPIVILVGAGCIGIAAFAGAGAALWFQGHSTSTQE